MFVISWRICSINFFYIFSIFFLFAIFIMTSHFLQSDDNLSLKCYFLIVTSSLVTFTHDVIFNEKCMLSYVCMLSYLCNCLLNNCMNVFSFCTFFAMNTFWFSLFFSSESFQKRCTIENMLYTLHAIYIKHNLYADFLLRLKRLLKEFSYNRFTVQEK